MPSDLTIPTDNRYKPIDPLKPLHEILDSVRQLTFMKEHSETLLAQLDEKIRLTYEKAPVGRLKPDQTYKLQRQEKKDSAIRERKLEKDIWMQWSYEKVAEKGQPFYGDICPFIQTYQMPLQGTWKDEGWGKIDLVGASSQAMPVVIELKREGASDTPLRMLAEGLAYGCAVKKAWNKKNSKIRREWTVAMEKHSISNAYPETISALPIILLAPSEFWEQKIGEPGKRTNGKVREDAWSPFVKLCSQCQLHGFEILCVKVNIDTSDPNNRLVSQGSRVDIPCLLSSSPASS